MSDRREWILRIEGMTCDHCATTVDAALTGVPGVHAATTRYADGEVRILTVGDVDGAALAAAVARRGYRVVGQAARPVDDDAATAWRGVDLAVVGSGAAGFAAAIRAAERGARVAIVEAGVLGGTCVNVGCVPSKTMIRAAEAMHRAGHHGFAGVRTWAERPDLASIVAQKDALVDALRTTKYEDVLTAYPAISLVRGRARLRRDGGLDVDGRSLGAGKVVVATGAAPWAPPIPGLAEAGYLTSTDALALTELPRRLVVLGGGAVGLEVAQTFARLGTAVTVLEVQPRLVPGEDAEVGDALVGYLRDEGLEVALGAVIQRVGGGPGGYRIDVVVDGAPRTLATEQLLVAAGRRPRTSGLGLADAGVQTGARGEVVVDVYLETTRPGVFAAGDVIGEPALVYLAAHAGALAADNALGGEARRYEVTAVPRVTFTDPAVA
ncbi:MAG: FAD-dependent oxidoreductase, partial [Myxococcales bacterium]|nr:FAD-dependent oxidoreductase [Myxococcales bacterium]